MLHSYQAETKWPPAVADTCLPPGVTLSCPYSQALPCCVCHSVDWAVWVQANKTEWSNSPFSASTSPWAPGSQEEVMLPLTGRPSPWGCVCVTHSRISKGKSARDPSQPAVCTLSSRCLELGASTAALGTAWESKKNGLRPLKFLREKEGH